MSDCNELCPCQCNQMCGCLDISSIDRRLQHTRADIHRLNNEAPKPKQKPAQEAPA